MTAETHPADRLVGAAFAGTRALVTGGAGFVGSNLGLRLLREGVSSLVVVDNLLSAERWSVPEDPAVEFVHGSIADEAVLSRFADDFDYVFHLATFHGNQSSIARPLQDHDNNAITTLRLLDHVKGWTRLRKVVYSSAGCSLGEKVPGGPTVSKEDLPVSLYFDSPYQISKILGEMYGNFYFAAHGVPFVKARFQNVYGPREILGAGEWRGTPATVWRNVTPTFVYRALTGLPLTVEGEGASRDLIFVEDIVEGLCRCAAFGAPGQVYNLGTGTETPILDLARKILALTGSSSELRTLPRRSWDSSVRRYGATDKAYEQIGFKAAVNVDEGLQRMLAWTRENFDRIQASIVRHDEAMRAIGA